MLACGEAELVGTLDDADGSTGLLIVTGGNEVRAGAWNGQALLAARIARAGFPVFRFDRRGVGESSGENAGFRNSGDDIAAAVAAFRREAPQVERIVGFGNCDGASALMLGGGAGLNGLVLANPWTIEHAGEAPPPAALRAHYWRRLKDPAALARLLGGRVSPRALWHSLRGAAARAEPAAAGLAGELRAGLAAFRGPVSIVLAGRDRTAQVFRARWDRSDPRVTQCDEADHSFTGGAAQDWLADQIVAALSRQSD